MSRSFLRGSRLPPARCSASQRSSDRAEGSPSGLGRPRLSRARRSVATSAPGNMPARAELMRVLQAALIEQFAEAAIWSTRPSTCRAAMRWARSASLISSPVGTGSTRIGAGSAGTGTARLSSHSGALTVSLSL